MFPKQKTESRKETSVGNKGLKAMMAASQIAIEHGTAEMTLDEINDEISDTRNGLKSQK